MIPERALQLLDKDGFIGAYFEGIRAGQSCRVAFESANDEYYMYFHKFKYADYNSFRHVRDYEQKKFRKQGKRFLKPFK